jgi:Leucine-rich repeat (LRR) protein
MKTERHPSSYVLTLSNATKEDRNKEILVLDIDTIDLVKLKSLKKVHQYHIGDIRNTYPIPLDKVIDMLSQLDCIPYLIFRNVDSLPSNITKLKKLQALAIVNVKVEELPENFVQLNDLQYLQISYSGPTNGHKINRLKKLPNNISKLKNLKALRLENTNLRTLPIEICELNNICLVIKENRMDSLPNCLCNLNVISTYQKNLLEKLPCKDRFK